MLLFRLMGRGREIGWSGKAAVISQPGALENVAMFGGSGDMEAGCTDLGRLN